MPLPGGGPGAGEAGVGENQAQSARAKAEQHWTAKEKAKTENTDSGLPAYTPRLAAEELSVIIARGIDLSSLKEDQETIIKALRDKLHVEI